jgi:hypothetical protein
MASIYGTSKVWGEIKKKLEAIKLKADHPREIEPLLERCTQAYEHQLKQVRQRLASEISILEQEIAQEREKSWSSLKTFSEYSTLEIAQIEANLDLLKHDHSVFNLIRNYFRTRRETRRLAKLREELDHQRGTIELPAHTKEIELEQKKAQRDEITRQECQEIIAQIDFLKSISGSQELASASAEIELQEYLKPLPRNVHIFNNVNLRVSRGFLFEGMWLINAHIDILLVTPAGLFAIEVKNWSKQIEEKGSTANPYEPIKRAAQLCYEIIKPDFPGVTVRSILAYRGHTAEYQNSGIVKVLPLTEVQAYINWFTDNTLTEQSLQKMITRIQEINAELDGEHPEKR